MNQKIKTFRITNLIYLLISIAAYSLWPIWCIVESVTDEGVESGIFIIISAPLLFLITLLLLSQLLVRKDVKKGVVKRRHFVPSLLFCILPILFVLYRDFLSIIHAIDAGRLQISLYTVFVHVVPLVVVSPLLIVTIKALKSLSKKAPPETEKVNEQETSTVRTETSEFVLSGKTEIKDEKPRTNKVGFVLVSIIYAALLIMSVVTLAGVNVLWDNDRALNLVTAGWLIAFCASFGLYFFLLAPFHISGKAKKIGAFASVIGMLLLDILPIVLLIQNAGALQAAKNASMFGWFNNYVLMVVTILLSEIGIVTTLLLTQARFDPNKLKKKKAPKDDHRDSFVVSILKFLIWLVIGIFNSAMALMRLKEKHINAYACLVSLLFSLLCCVLSEVMVILAVVFVVGFLVMLAGRFIEFSYTPATKYEATIRDENGKEIKVHQYSYQGSRWEDDQGNVYEDLGLGNYRKV